MSKDENRFKVLYKDGSQIKDAGVRQMDIYITAKQRNSRWFIDESEPVKSVDRRKKKN